MTIDTLLFDLDGTLVEQFQPGSELQFTWLVLRRFWDLAPPWRVWRAGRAAHRALKTHRSDRTNYEAMVETFCAGTGVAPEEMRARARHFCEHDFQAMGWRFKAVPGAPETVRLARSLGFRLVLATNPTVPIATVHHRLAWAGLDDIEWAFISHPENMTRSKPDVAYYHELLEAIEAAPGRCLMIGNDFRKDLPAMDAGVRSFLLDGPLSRQGQEARARYTPDHTGDHAALQALLRTLAAECGTAAVS